MKPIRFSTHARDQLRRRGSTEQEVVEAIRSSLWESADRERFACSRNFPYRNEWNGKFYQTKQVRPIFADEPEEMTVKISYDHEVDALYIRFKETTVTTKHIEDGIALDYDAAGCLAGIEILDARKRLDDPEAFKQVVF